MQAARTVCAVPSVDRTPPSEQVAEAIRKDIRAGRLSPGDELPSTRRMAALWDISAPTANRVLRILREEGWVLSRPGKPAIVAPDHPRDR